MIYRAINFAAALLELQEKLIPNDLVSQYTIILAKLRMQNSQDLVEADRIVAVLNQNHWQDPRNFKDCFLAVLQIWDIDEFVGFGHINPLTGKIIDS